MLLLLAVSRDVHGSLLVARPRPALARVHTRVTVVGPPSPLALRAWHSTAEAEYVLRTIEERGIRFVRLWFTDVLGFLKSFTITSQELEGAFAEGMGFDGSSIEGFSRIQESDMVAVPDPATFQVIPWKSEAPVARMFCDVFNPDGTPFDGDPRGVLKRQLQRAADLGFTFYVGPELEYFYFRAADDPTFLDHGGYFDETPLDVATDYRKRTVQYLEAMGIPVEYVHHEVAPSPARDRPALHRRAHDGRQRHDLPPHGEGGRAGVRHLRHLHAQAGGRRERQRHAHAPVAVRGRPQRVLRRRPTSTTCRRPRRPTSRACSGTRPRSRCVTNQWVNSYKRLVPGYEAPVYVCWARRNRSALVRVPQYKPGKEEATRIEYRSPDPACNPYLAFAAMLGGRPGRHRGRLRAAARGVATTSTR